MRYVFLFFFLPFKFAQDNSFDDEFLTPVSLFVRNFSQRAKHIFLQINKIGVLNNRAKKFPTRRFLIISELWKNDMYS